MPNPEFEAVPPDTPSDPGAIAELRGSLAHRIPEPRTQSLRV